MAATHAAQAGDHQAYKPAVGDRVMVGKNVATVRFIGPTQFACGEWIGCELDDASGKNDGSVQGTRYFECKAAYGIFVREGMVKKAPAKKKSVNGKAAAAAAAAAESAEATELRLLLAEAAEEHDVERLRDLLPRAESCGVSQTELENAQHILTFQVQNKLLNELDDVRDSVARLADVVASVEARASAVERAVLARSSGAAEADEGKGEASPGIESLLFDTALMDNWIKDFGEQLQQRVWETLEEDMEAALEKAVEKATHGLSALDLASTAGPPPSTSAPGAALSDVERVRTRAKASLVNAEQNGKLGKMMQGPPHSADAVRERAKNVLLDAERSGQLEAVLADTKGGKTEVAAGSMTEDAAAARIQAMHRGNAVRKAKPQVNVFNENPQEKLMREMQEENAKLKALLAAAEAPSDIERVRARAKASLVHAEQNGKLGKMMGEMKTKSGQGDTSAVEFTDTDGDVLRLALEGSKINEYVNGKLVTEGVRGFRIDAQRRSYKDDKGGGGFIRPEQDLGQLQREVDELFVALRQAQSDVERVRARAKASLVNAEQNGKLGEMMGEKTTKSGQALPFAMPFYPQAVGIEGGLLSAAAVMMPTLLF